MTLSAIQCKTLQCLRRNRSPRSWLAGSVLLHQYLSRPIGDIDIHHAQTPEWIRAVEADCALLESKGYVMARRIDHDFEMEARLLLGNDEILINWVLAREPRYFAHTENGPFGTSLHVCDAILEKIRMAFHGESCKHFEDLSLCANAGLLFSEFVDIVASEDDASPALFRSAFETNIRRSPLLRKRDLYAATPADVRATLSKSGARLP